MKTKKEIKARLDLLKQRLNYFGGKSVGYMKTVEKIKELKTQLLKAKRVSAS